VSLVYRYWNWTIQAAAAAGPTTETLTHAADAVLEVQGATLTHVTDATLEKQGNTLAHTADAVLVVSQTVNHSSDSTLEKTQTQTHVAFAAIEKQGNLMPFWSFLEHLHIQPIPRLRKHRHLPTLPIQP
jgi:hypothetical protein